MFTLCFGYNGFVYRFVRPQAMAFVAAIRDYASKAFRWQSGRQGTGYDKMLLISAPWPLPFDSYLIRYPEGSQIPPHTDPISSGRHYRLNIILKSPRAGGEFVCASPIFESKRIKLFRPDACEHSVTKVEGGSRYVLSIGWVLGKPAA
jgi:hypothetical protein